MGQPRSPLSAGALGNHQSHSRLCASLPTPSHFFHLICVHANPHPSPSVRPSTCPSFILFTRSFLHLSRFSLSPSLKAISTTLIRALIRLFCIHSFSYTSTRAYVSVPGLPATSLPYASVFSSILTHFLEATNLPVPSVISPSGLYPVIHI